MWLISADVRQTLEQAYRYNNIPSADQQMEYEARHNAESSSSSRILTIDGSTAKINVSGLLTKKPDLMALLFGGGNTVYGDIVSALADAEQDSRVDRAELLIDSPGGQVDGLFETVEALQTFDKPLTATVTNTAASAAYALASQADELTATNRAVRVGSVGIVGTFLKDDSLVNVTSTDAPKKRPDVDTDEGKAIVREELDAMHSLFVEAIADGRDIDKEKVNADFGQGATLLADEALKRGMIDAIKSNKTLQVVKSAKSTTATGGKKKEISAMDLNTLRAQHPDVYAAAVQEGVNQERDRAVSHLTMGDASGDMETAIKAINEGTGMTASLQAKYLAAGMNRNDQKKRADDDEGLSSTVDNADTEASDDVDSKAVLSLVEQRLGIAEGV